MTTVSHFNSEVRSWLTAEDGVDDFASVAGCSLDEPFSEDTPQEIIDAYTEFSWMSND